MPIIILSVFIVIAACFCQTMSPLFADTEVKRQPEFDWIETQGYNTSTPSFFENPNVLYLLYDQQVHVEQETTSRRIVARILNEIDIGNQSNIHISFDPAYQTLVMHHIDVIRDGKKIDKLEAAYTEIVRTENDHQRRFYDGRRTYVAAIEDIRIGDILDYSYSIIGFNPITKPYYYTFFSFDYGVPVEKVSSRIVANSSRNFIIKSNNKSINTNVKDVGSELREWSWQKSNSFISKVEDTIPSWYIDGDWIEVSDYPSCEWISKNFQKAFQLEQSCLDQQCSPELTTLLEKWLKIEDPEEKAMAAVHFVQDQVRYLYFDSATPTHVPNDPHTVFKRRFGDCKDKTQLLHFLLQKLNIKSYPCLVNAQKGKYLPERLPGISNFNHVVLQLDFDDKIYWVDPTIIMQGGDLKTLYFPNYENGLLIKNGSKDIIELPKNKEKAPINVYSIYDLKIPEQTHLSVETTYRNSDADCFRVRLTSEGETRLLENYENYYRQVYGTLSSICPLTVFDNRNENIISATEVYELNEPWVKNERNEISFSILPHYILPYLKSDFTEKRRCPLAIEHPLNIIEEVKVTNLPEWCKTEDQFEEINNNYFNWKKQIVVEGSDLKIRYEFQTLQEYIPASEVIDYQKELRKIFQSAEELLTIPPPEEIMEETQTVSRFSWLNIGLLIIGLFAWLKLLNNLFK